MSGIVRILHNERVVRTRSYSCAYNRKILLDNWQKIYKPPYIISIIPDVYEGWYNNYSYEDIFTGVMFRTLKEAANSIGYDVSHLSKCISGKLKNETTIRKIS